MGNIQMLNFLLNLGICFIEKVYTSTNRIFIELAVALIKLLKKNVYFYYLAKICFSQRSFL